MILYNVKNYGALADGVTDDGCAIQKAIDECAKNGGGRVVLESGSYYSHSIQLRENVLAMLFPSFFKNWK